MKIEDIKMKMDKFHEHNGEVHNTAEWARTLGMNKSTLRNRLRKGESISSIIENPSKKYKQGREDKICGATSIQDCFKCKFKDCVSDARVLFHDEPTVTAV